ncbi:cysteine desulfurase family protein [Microlunatus sp. Y2014]|uniref:cysteine desulfurase family protein n=1 Tax=Microlunatus sp. Y2014 TaxID=3418488 RepID=UPI003DA6DC84
MSTPDGSRADRSYLDHAATSPLVAVAREAMLAELDRVGNASSLHASGRAARRVVEEARESLAASCGCHPTEVIWTSGGTEADNLFLTGAWAARAPERDRPQRNRVVVSAVEHPAIMETHAALARRGADAVTLDVTAEGVAQVALLPGLLTVPTAAVSVMWVNNETGVVQPVTTVAEHARAAGAWSHADAVQALGHVPVDFAGSGLDAASLSAHKVGGPIGVGALLLRRGIELTPIGFGGGQERDLRSGTLAPALVAGFAAAAGSAVAQREGEAVRLGELRSRIDALAGRLDGVTVNGAPAERSPAISNLTFDGLRADDLLMLLDAAGVDSSTGSACTAGVSQPSDVLLAMGRTVEQASASLRFSLGHSTTAADIDRLVTVLPDAVARARSAYGR